MKGFVDNVIEKKGWKNLQIQSGSLGKGPQCIDNKILTNEVMQHIQDPDKFKSLKVTLSGDPNYK